MKICNIELIGLNKPRSASIARVLHPALLLSSCKVTPSRKPLQSASDGTLVFFSATCSLLRCAVLLGAI